MTAILSKVQQYMKVDEATSTRDDITPVYLLEEVYEMAVKGDDVAGLVDFMIKRLQHRSPVVKQKTLRLIKYISTKRAPEFKRLMGRHAAAVRELTHFRGEPDPFKGDVPNQKVRDMAKEALEALFSAAEPPSYSQTQSSNTKGRIQGFGSAANSEPTPSYSSASSFSTNSYSGATGGGGSSRYVGFGNPMMENKTAPSSSAVQTVNATFDMAKQWAYQAGQAVGITGIKPSNSRSMLGEDSSHNQSSYNSPGMQSSSYAAPAAPQQFNGSAAARVQPARTSAPSAPGVDEERVVESICRPGGLRPQPEKADLVDFVEAVSILDGSRVALLLEERMVGGPWQTSLRALCALEAVINQGASSSCGEIAVHFQNNPEAVKSAASSNQASLRIRANAVLQLLGCEAAPAAASTRTRGPAVPAQPEVSLLDLGGDEPAAATATSTAAVADLLGGAEAATAAPAGGDSLFSGLDVGASTASANAAADLFGGLSLAAEPTPAPASVTAPTSNGNLLDDLAAVSSSTTVGAAPALSTASTTAKSLSSIADLLPPSSSHTSSASMPFIAPGASVPVAAVGGATGMPGGAAFGQQQRMMQGMVAPGMVPMHPGVVPMQQGMMMMQPGMLPGMPGGMQPMVPMMQGLPMMQGSVPPGAIPVMPGMGMQPHMQGFALSKASAGPMMGITGGTGPIPLEAFHTSMPTPIITPKQDDKFDFIGDALKGKV